MSYRLMFLIGFNLSVLHLCLLKEFASLRYCTETLLLFLLVSFFFGQSLGFLYHKKFQGRALPWCLAWLALPLPILLLIRVLSGYLRSQSLPLLFYLLIFLYLTSLTAIYSSFLPQTIEQSKDRSKALARAYSAELGGSLCGVLLLVILASHQALALILIYPISLLLLAAWVQVPKGELKGLASLVLIAGLGFALADHWSTVTYYRLAFNFPDNTRLIFRENSPYQKVEVLEKDGEKMLFLNGVEFFSQGSLDNFNFYLSEVPAKLMKPEKVLIVGSGSMSAVGRISAHAGSVTTVELDPAVVRASQAHFVEEHPESAYDHKIVIDDARRFLRESEERFDLIILDIPTAFTIQTGTLFTRDFFALAKSRLNKGGVLSIYLTQPVSSKYQYPVAGPILAAVNAEFSDFILLTAYDVENSFVYASEEELPFSRSVLDRLLGEEGRFEQRLFEKDLARRAALEWEPSSLTNLKHIWRHQ